MSERVLSVSEFHKLLNTWFQESFPTVVVEGEVSEYRLSQGKWIWFKLKDQTEEAVLDCFTTVFDLPYPLQDGMLVRVTGRPSTFARSGKFSFRPVLVVPVGSGALQRAFELLKAKLQTEGLFAPERKRPLPRFPERIGLITSKEAAAYTDFLKILSERWPAVLVRFFPVPVQGAESINSIAQAFQWFNAHEQVDLVVLTRGGGSVEELQAFNSEPVARSIVSSRAPVISAVGHERDVTIADLVADVRAATPTQAASLAVPDRTAVLEQINVSRETISQAVADWLAERLIAIQGQREAILAAWQRQWEHLVNNQERLRGSLRQCSLRLGAVRLQVSQRVAALSSRFANALSVQQQRLASLRRVLENLNPQRLLKRGYSITRLANGKLLRRVEQAGAGVKLGTQLAEGQVRSTVE